LAEGNVPYQQADRFERCVDRVMQHAAYDCEACKDMV